MKISVILRTCKRPELFKKALASIELQTHNNWEVLIYDDAGSDENFTIYRKFKERNKDKRVFYIASTEAYTMFRNSWLYSPHIVEGEVMVRLDDDDMLVPDSLEFIANLYQRNPQLDFSYGTSVTNEDDTLGFLIEGKSPFEIPRTKDAWAPYTVPNNMPWHEPWTWYRDYYKEPMSYTSLIHAAKINVLCVFHLYTMRTSSIKKVVGKMTVTSKFVDDLEFLGTLDYLQLSHAPIKKVLCYYGVHKQGKVTDRDNINDNTDIFNENFRVRDKVDHSRPDGFQSRVILLDIQNNTNNGVDDGLISIFNQFNKKVNKIVRSL
jgi:glycosyltransferase involved in cell wall biosynthesis